MNPRFEEHESQLFRMLEKPVPLTPDAEMPCLVRLIQDDTMLGKANKRLCRSDTIGRKIVCTKLTDDGLFMHGNYSYRYEIIGYPVDEGSHWWALYQMMQGEKAQDKHGYPYEMRNNLIWRVCPTSAKDYTPRTQEVFIAEEHDSGWQIYKEPKQPKSAYQAGDFVVCTYYRSPLPQKNSYERVIEVSGNGIVTKANDGCVTEYDINGNHGDINGWHIERLVKPEEYIICIGCLSGTVEKASDFDMFLLWHSKKDCDYSMIRFDALDTRTRELVDSLLEAMQEDK